MKTLSDLAAPAQVVRKLLEADVQKTCVDWARARGYWARKFSSIAQRSVPDFLFSAEVYLMPEYKIKFACEFKKPGTKKKLLPKHGVKVMSTEAQFEEQAAMRLAGWFVFECDNFENFKLTVLAYEKEITGG